MKYIIDIYNLKSAMSAEELKKAIEKIAQQLADAPEEVVVDVIEDDDYDDEASVDEKVEETDVPDATSASQPKPHRKGKGHLDSM